MGRKRTMEHGPIIGGRLQLDRETRDVIRCYTRIKYKQAMAEHARAKAAHARMNTEQSAGQLKYAEHVLEWLEGLYSQGQHSVSPVDWAEAWVHTTASERHTLAVSDPHPTIPGME